MTQQQAAQPGSPEPLAAAPQGAPQAAPQAATPEPHQPREAPRRKAAPRARGFVAAFGSGSGAAWVFRDLASI